VHPAWCRILDAAPPSMLAEENANAA